MKTQDTLKWTNESTPKPIISDVADLLHPSLKHIKVIGIVGDPDNGKTNVINYIIRRIQKDAPNTTIAAHGLKNKIEGVITINTLADLETLREAVIFIDEWADLVDVYNQRQMRKFEQTIRTIYQPHKNNVVFLVGMARNFNGKISGMLNAVILKQTTVSDAVQRSVLANILAQYSGGFQVTKGEVLSMEPNVALVKIVGGRFDEVEIPYVKDGDVKRDNKPVVKWNYIKAE